MAAMELKEFITRALSDIIDGVSEAQRLGKPKGANINPIGISFQRDGQWNNTSGPRLQEVEFDVGLTRSENKEAEGKIGVLLGSVGLGSKGKTESEKVSVTRIRFTVPLLLPPGEKS